MHTEIEATYRVVTPMFCGGAEPDKRAELRPSSFKGVLRFWWRALAWSRLGGDLGQIKQQEDALFGSADGGRSSVSMQFVPGAEPGSVAAGRGAHCFSVGRRSRRRRGGPLPRLRRQ